MGRSYTYDPARIKEYGKDKMRFELGDTDVDGKEETCALCDEEYSATIPEKVRSLREWKKAKLKCLEHICHRFAYEPNTKVGPVTLSLGDRAKMWKEMFDKLDAELRNNAASASTILALANNPETGAITPPYFYNGMMSHEEVEGQDI